MSPALKRELWTLMHETHMRTAVFQKMQIRYTNRSKAVLILQALAASGAVGGWALWSYEFGVFEMQWIAAVFLGVVAVTSIIHPALNWPVIVSASRIVARGWAQLNNELESVWRDRDNYSDGELRAVLDGIGTHSIWLKEIETELPRDTDLARTCYNETERYYTGRR